MGDYETVFLSFVSLLLCYSALIARPMQQNICLNIMVIITMTLMADLGLLNLNVDGIYNEKPPHESFARGEVLRMFYVL
jgi:hypothetical protein